MTPVPDQFVSVNLTKLRVMKQEWEAVVLDRGRALVKMKERLDQRAEPIPVEQAKEVLDIVMEFGKAGGQVACLEQLIADITSAPVATPTEAEPHAEGDFRSDPPPGDFRL